MNLEPENHAPWDMCSKWHLHRIQWRVTAFTCLEQEHCNSLHDWKKHYIWVIMYICMTKNKTVLIQVFQNVTPFHWVRIYLHFEGTVSLRNVRNHLFNDKGSQVWRPEPSQPHISPDTAAAPLMCCHHPHIHC